jgi:hypothetical protein
LSVSGTNYLSEELTSGALIAYTLAILWAFWDELPFQVWDHTGANGHLAISIVMPFLKYVISISSLMIVAHRLLASDEAKGNAQGAYTTLAFLFAFVAFVGAVVVLRTKVIMGEAKK